MYYKDRLRSVCDNLIENIFECSYEIDKKNIKYYYKKIKCSIAQMDFMLDRLYTKKYINSTNLYRVANVLIEVNKLVTGWLKVLDKNESINK